MDLPHLMPAEVQREHECRDDHERTGDRRSFDHAVVLELRPVSQQHFAEGFAAAVTHDAPGGREAFISQGAV